MRIKLALSLLLSLIFSNIHAFGLTQENYLLATASTGGTYYPVGVALATLTKVKIQPKHGSGMSAINTAGSAANIRMLRDLEVEFAIVQGLYGKYAWRGTGPLKDEGRQSHLRSVTTLWKDVEQFVVKKEHAGSGTMADLTAMQGMKLALGNKNSGAIVSNRFLLGNLGLDMERDFVLLHAGYDSSASALQGGQVDGINTSAGVPTGAMTKLFAAAADEVQPLEVSDAELKRMDGGSGLWSRYVIPAGTYPGQDKAWRTIAHPAFLAVRDDVSEEFVYLLTKTIYENLPFLQAIHDAPKAMSLENALVGLSVPLHPGAMRYYEEVGIEIPEHLSAD